MFRRGFGRLEFREGFVLGGLKFPIQADLRPVYRRPRFDYGESLLSGPAWAGLLAVVLARRKALRAWLGQGGFRFVAVGALAAGLGVQAGTTPSVARGAANGHADPSHSSAAKRATGDGGLAAGLLNPSGSDGDLRANAGRVLAATDRARLRVGGGQGRRLAIPGMGAAAAQDGRIDGLGEIGLSGLFGLGGSNSSSRRPGDYGSDPGETGPASGSSTFGSSASVASEWPSEDAPPAAGVVFGWQVGLPFAVLAGRADPDPILIAGGLGQDMALGSTRLFEDVHGQGPGGGGSADFASADLSGVPPVGLDAPGPGGVPEPASWVTMLVGMTLVGGSARRRRVQA